MAVNRTSRTQYVAYGHVTGSVGSPGSRAADVTYSATIWDVDTGTSSIVAGFSPQRDVPDDTEIDRVAPNGWPIMRSVLPGVDIFVMWPGGERYKIEECPA